MKIEITEKINEAKSESIEIEIPDNVDQPTIEKIVTQEAHKANMDIEQISAIILPKFHINL